MKFEWTPEEAHSAALAVARHLKRHGAKVKVEVRAWPDAPYKTTLVATRLGLVKLVEAQGTLDYGPTIKGLAEWLAAKRHYAELYLASTDDSTVQAGILSELKKDGVGLLVVDGLGKLSVSQNARNPALVVMPDPTLKYGDRKIEVQEALRKFNDTNRKDGLRDMCELVELETEKLGVAAVKKSLLKVPESAFKAKDWSDQINCLASVSSYNINHSPLIDNKLKDDLHSFRGARNLVDHKVSGKRDDARRQRQFHERMTQGPRLVADLVSLRRKVK